MNMRFLLFSLFFILLVVSPGLTKQKAAPMVWTTSYAQDITPTVDTIPQLPCQEIPRQECEALRTLYIGTNGAAWENQTGWNKAQKPCEWFGVTCRTDEKGSKHVYELRLAWNQLQGTIPPALQYLTELQLLDLSGNLLSGSIPPELGGLTKLKTLNLSENQLAGAVPVELARLTSLNTLHLFETGLSGDLPIEFTELKNLRNFKFQNSRLCSPKDAALEAWLDRIYYLSRAAPGDCQPLQVAAKPLVLIYAVLDNNLNSEWGRLLNNAEQGVRAGAFDVKLFVDAKGQNNSYEYTLQEDHNQSCPSIITNDLDCNRYRFRSTLRSQFEDTAQRDSLSSFVSNAIFEYPHASHIVLALVGHGAGWGANALPAQPKGYETQSGVISDTLGGMLWDDTSSDNSAVSQSLSTFALGDALRQIKLATGRTIDLLYLDACSMAMAEVIYEVRDSVHYLLASENTKWATFPYQSLLPLVANMTSGRMLGEQWLEQEKAILQDLPDYRYTFSLIDLAKMDQVITATTMLADALSTIVSTEHLLIKQAFLQASHFDSNYDSSVNEQDAFVDLADFARQIAIVFAGRTGVVTAADAVEAAVRSAVVRTVFADPTSISATDRSSIWTGLGGVSIYLPLATDEVKRRELYNGANLAWARQGKWDELLESYWQSVEQAPDAIPISQCAQTEECPSLTGWGFLPEGAVYTSYLPIMIE